MAARRNRKSKNTEDAVPNLWVPGSTRPLSMIEALALEVPEIPRADRGLNWYKPSYHKPGEAQ